MKETLTKKWKRPNPWFSSDHNDAKVLMFYSCCRIATIQDRLLYPILVVFNLLKILMLSESHTINIKKWKIHNSNNNFLIIFLIAINWVIFIGRFVGDLLKCKQK
jgi:purine-cytosine permease-like protein